MKKLIITRGLPGSGKSTTLQQTRLSDFTISTDTLRMLYSSPVMTFNGKLAISQNVNPQIWMVLYEILKQRMQQGHTTVIDAVHPLASDFKEYINLAKKYDYDIACLDFTQVPTDVVNWSNEGRDEYKIVPEEGVKRLQKLISESEPLPENLKIITVKSDRSHLNELNEWLMPEVKDLSQYKEIVHIGDIQGCLNPLKKALPNGIEDDKFYIFIGDFCDRGEENAEVVKYMLDNVIGKPNVQTLIGNHEYHLFREIDGLEPVSDEFKLFTKKQFGVHGISHKDIRKLLSGIKDVFFYTYEGKKVMASHGGLPKIPKKPWMIPSHQYETGVGFYEQDVDTMFSHLSEENQFQVHGHRNNSKLPIINQKSINLEGSVEKGGHLRVVKLNENGWNAEEYKNDIIRPWRKRLKKGDTIMPEWMNKEDNGTIMPEEMLTALREHDGVNERQSKLYPWISSLSFTKEVFYDKTWDDIVNKARGLFIDKDTGEIIARSYEKFFTVDENEEMKLDNLCEKLQFPIVGRLKENGFLGITGYIAKTDELFISSKGTPEGEFADMFKEIFNESLNVGKQEELKHIMRDLECSFVFEVIDPVRDPHMVEYDKRKIVLLDVVRRSSNYEKLPYKDVVQLGRHFGFEVAPEMLRFKDEKSFRGWYKRASKDIKKEIEGYVWQDKTGYMFKTKSPFYSFWKLMRGTKEAIFREKNYMNEIINHGDLKRLMGKINKTPDVPDFTKETKDFVLSKLNAKKDFSRNELNDIVTSVKDKGFISSKFKGMISDAIPMKKMVSRQSTKSFLETRDLDFLYEEADNFKNWCFEQTPEVLEKNIIDIRKEFFKPNLELKVKI